MHGNTSAASVPLALSVAVADGRIKQGDLVLLEAMGGGFTWGAVIERPPASPVAARSWAEGPNNRVISAARSPWRLGSARITSSRSAATTVMP